MTSQLNPFTLNVRAHYAQFRCRLLVLNTPKALSHPPVSHFTSAPREAVRFPTVQTTFPRATQSCILSPPAYYNVHLRTLAYFPPKRPNPNSYNTNHAAHPSTRSLTLDLTVFKYSCPVQKSIMNLTYTTTR